jgi:hypothetical protein
MRQKAFAVSFMAVVIILATAAVASGTGSRVRVEDVGTLRVERLLRASLEATVAPDAVVAPATCEEDRRGDGKVWFLPLFVAPGTAEVSCAVPARSWLVLNLGGSICIEDDVTPRDALVQCAIQGEIDFPSLQTALIDGKNTDEFASEPTRVFEADLPEGNVFGAPAGKTAFAYAGRNILIKGLDNGEHTIRFFFRSPPGVDDFSVDVTYHITVG